MATRKIPVTVITGFLGAGKTSLIRHLITHADGRRLALLINEFGEMGVDGEILKACGDEACGEDDIVELTNGCICCTVADDFLPTLNILLDREDPPDHILIETSGLALPKPLVKAFQWPEVRSRTTVDSVIAVVDGPAVQAGLFADDPVAVQAQREADEMLDHDSPLAEVYEDQLACADIVVLSKIDLMDGAALEQTKTDILADAGAGVQVIAADHGALDPALVLGVNAEVEAVIDGRWSYHDGLDEHEHDDFESITVDIQMADDPALISDRAQRTLAIEGVLRIKGVAAIANKNARLVVQGVGARLDHYYDRPWNPDEERAGRLVVIGLNGFDTALAAEILQG
ncbi:MAG: cobalamin biosynthesis protein CobW [Rhodospirillaceae bacterium]|nr:cobalamin biosynthesis protein CobW [Rhodospirillaceae bacterium]